jgi:putative flippase GtrA
VSDERNPIGDIYDKHGEALRYLIVGVWNTAVSFVVFALAIKFVAPPLEAATGWSPALTAVVLQWVIWVLMVVQSTVTMKYFAFRSKGHLGKQIFRAYFIYLPAQGLSSVILWGTMKILAAFPPTSHWPSQTDALVGQVIAIFVGTIFSYFGHKYFTFKTPLEVGEVPPRELIEGE